MAATVTASIQADNNGGGGQELTSGNITPSGSNRCIWALVGNSTGGTVANPDIVRYGGSGGTDMTLVSGPNTCSSAGRAALYRLIAPAASANTIYAHWGTAQDETWIIAVATQDTDQTTPNGTIATATSTNTAITVNAASVSGDLVLDFASFVDFNGNSRSLTVGANQTSLQENEAGGIDAYAGAGASSESATGTSTTMSWTISGTLGGGSWRTMAFAVNAASAGGQTLTQSARFDNSNTFYTHTLSAGSVALTQSSRFDNSATFYTHTLSSTYALTQASRFDNSPTFYTHVLTAGTAPLTQSARFDSSNSFYTHTLSTGAVALTQSARFDSSQTFYTHVLTSGAIALTQDSRFDNSATFYTHTLTPGALALAQSSRFDNSNTFYTHVLNNGGTVITQDARFDNSQTFYTHALSVGAVALTQSSRFDNSASFYAHTLTASFVSIARPSADVSAGAWLPSTGSDLYAMLDEEIADDADYIQATSATTCELALQQLEDPGTSRGQAFSYRAWSPEGNGVIVRLKQGATTIATWTHDTLPSTATTYARNLTASECDAITDYTALSVEFESTV